MMQINCIETNFIVCLITDHSVDYEKITVFREIRGFNQGLKTRANDKCHQKK